MEMLHQVNMYVTIRKVCNLLDKNNRETVEKTASLLVIVYLVEEFVPQTWPF